MPRNYKPRRNSKPKRKLYKKKTNAPRRMPYKSSRGKQVPYAYNVEVLQRNLPKQSTDFGAIVSATDLPANTTIHMPCMFNAQDTDLSTRVNGQWLTPKWLKSKFRISFDSIISDHADSAKGFNLWMVQGVVKSTGEKGDANTATWGTWTTDIKNIVGTQLVNSDLTADYLDFSKSNRNIRIISKKQIKGNRNGMLRKAETPGTTGVNYTAPSPVCLSINHALPNFKQRIASADTAAPKLNQSYIPFVAFYCAELTANTGTFTIEQSSRFYYTDM